MSVPPQFKLNKKKQYYIRRIGASTSKVTHDKIYIANYCKTFQEQWNWVIHKTDTKSTTTQPTLSAFSEYWLVLAATDGSHVVNDSTDAMLGVPPEFQPEKTEEKPMPVQFHSTSTGRMINTECASKFSDRDVIDFIKAQRTQKTVLAAEIGEESKYYKAKAKEFDADIKLLTAELESRA